ncbi:AraC family transcriptional regulator [Nocardia yamanashiensis]|uniref:AraC family transcriptional regulator n=1 Tax=Nocardia yamanashiensis TaxID=209247 RepID=UPI001E57E46F|nr:AraC family transcriptional regulator [Nocardia yamanashiensis]UGT39832.1 AraC family transcriptional regulator [Nocardia yamanashiensis]
MSTVQEAGIRDWDFPRGVASVVLMTGYAREHGVPAATLLKGSGLSEQTLANPDAQIDARTELAVIRNLVRELGERPNLGLEVGERYRISTFGIFGFACVSSPTLGEAISFALRYLELSFTFCIPVARWQPGEFVARIHDERVPADVRRFLVERDVTAMHRVLSDLLGHRVELLRAEFDFPAPPDPRPTSRCTASHRVSNSRRTCSPSIPSSWTARCRRPTSTPGPCA